MEQLIAAVKRDAKEAALAEGVVVERSVVRGGSEAARAKRREVRAAGWKASGLSRKQFVFAGATLPNAGTRNVESHVKRLLPAASWLRTEGAHRGREELKQVFVKVEQHMR